MKRVFAIACVVFRVLDSIGAGCWIFLRKYRVQARERSVYEYVTDENGKVVLDDNAKGRTWAFRNYATFGKLLELFPK